jgi:hypothetical protein
MCLHTDVGIGRGEASQTSALSSSLYFYKKSKCSMFDSDITQNCLWNIPCTVIVKVVFCKHNSLTWVETKGMCARSTCGCSVSKLN